MLSFDRAKGGTILSTEELFEYLARELRPQRILLAGLEEGVWADFPARKHRVQKLTRKSFDEIRQSTGKATGSRRHWRDGVQSQANAGAC